MCICKQAHSETHAHKHTARPKHTNTNTHTNSLSLSLSLSQLRPRTGRDIKTLMDLAPPSSGISALHSSLAAPLPTGSGPPPSGASCLLANHVVVCGMPACLDDFLAPFRKGMAGNPIRPRHALTHNHPKSHTLSLTQTHTRVQARNGGKRNPARRRHGPHGHCRKKHHQRKHKREIGHASIRGVGGDAGALSLGRACVGCPVCCTQESARSIPLAGRFGKR